MVDVINLICPPFSKKVLNAFGHAANTEDEKNPAARLYTTELTKQP